MKLFTSKEDIYRLTLQLMRLTLKSSENGCDVSSCLNCKNMELMELQNGMHLNIWTLEKANRIAIDLQSCHSNCLFEISLPLQDRVNNSELCQDWEVRYEQLQPIHRFWPNMTLEKVKHARRGQLLAGEIEWAIFKLLYERILYLSSI